MRIFGKDIIYLEINRAKSQQEFQAIGGQFRRYFSGCNTQQLKEQNIVECDKRFSSNLEDSWPYRGKSILYLDSDEFKDNTKLVDFYNNLKNNSVNITEQDKIYFSKASAYPRHRLANFTKNKRTIKKDKADFIVVPRGDFTFSKEALTLFKDQNGSIYKIGTYGRYYQQGTEGLFRFLFKKYLPQTELPVEEHDNDNFLIEYVKKTKGIALIPFTCTRLVMSSSKSEDIIDLYENYSEKVITEQNLDSYINNSGNAILLNEESFEMLSKMLKSDQTNVALGLRMMNSFDSTKSIIPISLLMLFNIGNIVRNKEWNTVGMKVLRNKLPFINNYTGDDIRSKINVLNRLSKDFVKTDKDREDIRKYGMPMIKQVVNQFIDRELKDIDFINKYNITLE